MRDLAEAKHEIYIKNNKKYYSTNVRNETNIDDYIHFIERYLGGKNYAIFHKHPWTYCNVMGQDMMVQGWKIHVSATIYNHIEILDIVAKYVTENNISFKFGSNYKCFIAINGKEMDRASAGKYIVVYPEQDKFEHIIEELYQLLKEYEGCYILSDKPYKDSKILFYRYGEILPISYVDSYGTTTTRILDENNNLYLDKRVPFFVLPPWEKDKFEFTRNSQSSILLSKYKIEKPLHFSSQGGVYLAHDSKNRICVLKEAREYTGIDARGVYATQRLEREYKLLKRLDGEYTPVVYEKIEDMGNLYIAEEFVEGKVLARFPYENSPLVLGEVLGKEKKISFVFYLKKIIRKCLKAVQSIHERGFVINDISPNNIIYNEETGVIKIIDLEVAQSIVDDASIAMYTPGFYVAEKDLVQADLKKIGLIIIFCIFPLNTMFDSFYYKIQEVISLFMKLEVIDEEICVLLKDIFEGRFASASECLKCFESYHFSNNSISDNDKDISHINTYIHPVLECMLDNLENGISAKSQFIPCDPMGFATNPYCLGYGVFGELFALKRMHLLEKVKTQRVNSIVRNFMCSFYKEASRYSSGLYVGLAGIAGALLECGYCSEAVLVIEYIDPSKVEICDFAYGLSGVLLVYLLFYYRLNNDKYLNCAMKCFHIIKEKAIKDGSFLYWEDVEGDSYTGMTRGNAGIAMALLFLYIVTNNKEILDMGVSGLENDLSRLEYQSDGQLKGFNGNRKNHAKIYSPYIHNGVAGLGIVLVRYYMVTHDNRYLKIVQDILHSCNGDITLFPGYLRGMSGIMSFLQDCIVYLGINEAGQIFHKMEETLGIFVVKEENWCGILGDQLYRASDDLLTGASGVLLTLLRKIELDRKTPNPFLVVDELFLEKCTQYI